MRTAHQDNVVGIIFSDFWDNGLGIDLEIFPFVLNRFVVEFVENVGMLAVFLCHLSKESLGFLGVHLVGMPVDDNVSVVLDGCINYLCDALHGKIRILQIVVFYLNAHGCTNNVGMPIVSEPLHGLFVVESWPDVVPSQAYASQYYRISTLVAQLCTFYLQLSPLLNRVCCIQLRHAEDGGNNGH